MGLSVSHLNKGRMDMLLSCSWRYWSTYDDGSHSKATVIRAAFLIGATQRLENFYNGDAKTKAELLKMYDEEVENRHYLLMIILKVVKS